MRIDLTGRRFGRFMVLAEVGSDKHRQRIWLCICDCGSHFTRTGSNILATTRRSSSDTACFDCMEKEIGDRTQTHGDCRGKKTVLYQRWRGMRSRCENPRVKIFKWYGGKGVKVCQDWLSFEAFKAWALANGFSPKLVIDRINSNGDYEPSNCEWVTQQENVRRMHVAYGHDAKAIH